MCKHMDPFRLMAKRPVPVVYSVFYILTYGTDVRIHQINFIINLGSPINPMPMM